MKKLLLILLLIPTVHAEEYEYLSSDIGKYDSVNKEDFIYTDYSDYLEIKPEEYEYREINSIKGYKYKKVKKTNIITFENYKGCNLEIQNFKIYNEKEELNYKINTTTLEENKNIIITLDNYYDMTKYIISYELISGKPLDIKYTLYYKKDDLVCASYGQSLSSGINTCKIIPNINSFNLREYDIYYFKEKQITNGLFKLIKENIELYTYRDKLYKYYNKENNISKTNNKLVKNNIKKEKIPKTNVNKNNINIIIILLLSNLFLIKKKSAKV